MTAKPRLPLWVAYALGSFFCYGITNSLLGALVEWSDHNPSTPVTAPFILWMTMGFVGVGAAAVFKLRGRGYKGLSSPRFMWIAILAGAALALGMLCIKLAVTKGPGGPATAITGSNSILVVLFEFFVFAHVPPTQKLVGMGIAIAGIIVLSLGGSRKAPAAEPVAVAHMRHS